MQTRSKLIIALSSLLAVTAGVAATSTFAWITSTRTATVTYKKATAYSNNGNLTLKYVAPTAGAAFNTPNITDYTGQLDITNAVAGGKITDISGDGVTFYKPKLTADSTDSIQKFVDGTYAAIANSDSTSYYVEFGIAFHNGNTDPATNKMKVYVNTGSSLLADVSTTGTTEEKAIQNAKNDLAAKATRVAFLAGSATPTLQAYWNPNSDATPIYMSSGTVADNKIVTTACTGLSEYVAGNYGDINLAATAIENQYLGEVADTDLAITVRMWLEGTSTSCINGSKDGQVNLTLSFGAVNS